jgi:hypothetical protein
MRFGLQAAAGGQLYHQSASGWRRRICASPLYPSGRESEEDSSPTTNAFNCYAPPPSDFISSDAQSNFQLNAGKEEKN